MILAVFLVFIAIAYAAHFRSEPLKVVYTGTGLLALGILNFIVFFIAMDTMNLASGSKLQEDIALFTLEASFVTIPVGILIVTIGFVLYKKSKSNACNKEM